MQLRDTRGPSLVAVRALLALLIANPPTKRAFFCQLTNSQLGFMIETKTLTVFNFRTAGPQQFAMRQLRPIDCANQKKELAFTGA
jgi:hypothetical protein